MTGLPQYSDIILFAMIAVFLVLRLRSVLGRRTGNERPPHNPYMPRARQAGDKVVTLEPNKVTILPPESANAPEGLAAGIAQIRRADPGFDAAQFLAGARTAFEMIVGAFARGDKPALRPLLSDEVFTSFSAAIDQRQAKKETLETRIERIASADLVEAGLVGRNTEITVKLVSDQIQVVRAADGSVLDGDPSHPVEKTDYWTFGRDPRSPDPNWHLVATSSG